MFDRMAVVGVGAIGSIIGGYLTRAGHDITLIDLWPEHVAAMKQQGLTVTAQDEDFTVPVKARQLAEVSIPGEPFDAVFVCVKSYDTIWAVHLILPYLKATGVIISAQNSVNDEWIAPIVGYARAIGCVITLGAALQVPGHVVRTSSSARPAFAIGELNGLPSARVVRLAEIMSVIGQSRVTTNLWGERWSKLATNCMANPIAALTGLGSAALKQTAGVVDATVLVAAEVIRVGRALGLEVEPIYGIPAELFERPSQPAALAEVKERLAERAKLLGEGRPSMLQDVLKGRRTEIEYLNGYVARKGREIGVPTPLNEAITALVKQVERGELKPDIANLERLSPYLPAR